MHLRVTESWKGHVSTIIWGGGGGGGGHCILGLIETTVVNLATCSVTPLSKIIGKLSANFGG